MDRPLVTVIIPAYNGEKYLCGAMQSVLKQDYPHIEIWVVDNGSTDRTGAIAQSFPQVLYRRTELADTAIARNLGLSLAKGEYIAFLDQDDLWPSHKISRQVNFLEIQTEYGAVIGLQEMYLEPGYTKPHWLKQAFLNTPQPAYLPSALMIRRSTLEITSEFNTAFPLASDVAWFLKAKHNGIAIGMIEEVLVYRRIHEENTSNNYLSCQKEILSALRNSLDERRGIPIHG